MMRTNLRGELTLYKDEKMHQFSVRDNELIDAVASHFKVGSTEVKILKHLMVKLRENHKAVIRHNCKQYTEFVTLRKCCIKGQKYVFKGAEILIRISP